MSRVRLTNKVLAAMEGKDIYNMNVPEKKDPGQKYQAPGDGPSAWAEDPQKQKPWDGPEKRDDMNVAVKDQGVFKNANERAVKAAKKLEEKAIKAIVASQRMLPGASDEMIEHQAADLLHLPDVSLTNTLLRQEELAKSISKEASKAAKKAKHKEEDEEVEAAKKKEEDEEVEAAKKKDEEEDEEVEAAKKKDEDEEEVEAAKKKDEEDEEEIEAAKKEEDEEVEAAKKKDEDEEEEGVEAALSMLEKQASEIQAALKKLKAGKIPEGLKKFQEMKKKKEEKDAMKKEDEEEVEARKKDEEEVEAAKKKDSMYEEDEEVEAAKKKDEEEVEAAKKKDEKEEEPSKDASSILDDIFESVTSTQKKAGAKTLSGLVKKASNADADDLASLWAAPPDVSKNF